MIDDGDIDYRNRSLEQLRESCWNIDRQHYPKNLQNLLRELAARGGTDPTTEAVPEKASETRGSARVLFEFAKGAYCTSAICVALLAIFALEFLCRGPGSGIENSVAAAGLIKSSAVHGEWWRLLTGALLHANMNHVYYNVVALFLFGGVVERIASRPILPLVVLLSALGGSVASLMLLPNTTTVGISGAVMGVMGFFLAYQLTRSPRLPLGAFVWVGANIGINLVVGAVAYSTIDNAAHIGGLLTGLLLGAMFTASHRAENQMPIQLPATARVLGLSSATVLIAAIGFTVFRLLAAS